MKILKLCLILKNFEEKWNGKKIKRKKIFNFKSKSFGFHLNLENFKVMFGFRKFEGKCNIKKIKRKTRKRKTRKKKKSKKK